MTLSRRSRSLPTAAAALTVAATIAATLTARQGLCSADLTDQSPLPSAASMIAPDISRLEDDIAQLEQKRDAVPPAALPWLELQIDSRIFSRWILTQAVNSGQRSSMQIGSYLHGASMLAIVPLIDDYASKQTAAPNSVQSLGASRIHQFTFELKDAKDEAAVDTAAAAIAQDVLIAITPMQGGQRLPALVPMRPPVAAATATAKATTVQGGPKTVDELAALARQASVSPALRKELIAMASLAQQSQADPARASETETLRDQLESALDLTAGLQANTAVTTEEREQIESQVCDGLALFSDPRLREAGRSRLGALDQYRQLLTRVGRMRVPPELKQALAPALAWAHENPDQGDRVLSAIEKFVTLHVRHEARPPQPAEFSALRPLDPLRRAYDEVGKEFVKARGDFLGDAADMGGNGAGSGTGTTGGRTAAGDGAAGGAIMNTGSGPDGLNDRVKEMTQLENMLDKLVDMPKTLQTLDAFRPRPTGGVDRRVNTYLIAIASPLKSPTRDEAVKQLTDLHKLGLTAEDLASQTVASVPPAVAHAYTGDEIGAIQTKWKSTVTELASSFAANEPMDADKLARLKAVRGLLDALGPATDMEAAFAKPDGLAKWADWTVTPEQVHALIAPYQQAMAQAFGGFVSDNPDALAEFSKLRPRFAPMMAMFTQTGSYSDACSALPDGTLGMLDRLGTPYDKAPFDEQRFASFVAALCASANGDSSVTDSAATAISDRIRR